MHHTDDSKMSKYKQGVKFWIAKTEKIDLVNHFVKKRSKKLKIDKNKNKVYFKPPYPIYFPPTWPFGRLFVRHIGIRL